MTFLFKRKSGIYYYRKTFVLPSGERQQIRQSLKTHDRKLAQYLALKMYFSTGSDQEAVVSAQSASEQRPVIVRPKSKPKSNSLKLSTAITNFLAEKSRTGLWCPKEYRRGEVMLEALGKLLGAVEVMAVGRQESNQFKQTLLATNRSITTINNYLKRASTLFEWLLQRGECADNPFKGLQLKQRRVLSELRDAYTDDDKANYLRFAKAQEEWRRWVLLLLRYTGARPSEICQLYKADIDTTNQAIAIHRKRPDQTLKTPNSARTIPIHSQLINAGFIDFVESCTHLRLFPKLNHLAKGGYSHTFVTWYAKARIRAKEAIAKGKGEFYMPELYGARHTAATEMKNAGIPNQFASAVLGHSNNSITYDRYGKGVEGEKLKRAVEAIGITTSHK